MDEPNLYRRTYMSTKTFPHIRFTNDDKEFINRMLEISPRNGFRVFVTIIMWTLKKKFSIIHKSIIQEFSYDIKIANDSILFLIEIPCKNLKELVDSNYKKLDYKVAIIDSLISINNNIINFRDTLRKLSSNELITYDTDNSIDRLIEGGIEPDDEYSVAFGVKMSNKLEVLKDKGVYLASLNGKRYNFITNSFIKEHSHAKDKIIFDPDLTFLYKVYRPFTLQNLRDYLRLVT